jgi:cytochrome oxidase assembly protein ShyY1
VSGDGRYVAFLTINTALGPNWQVARKDRKTGALELVSATATGKAANSGTDDDTVSISANGRYVSRSKPPRRTSACRGSWAKPS